MVSPTPPPPVPHPLTPSQAPTAPTKRKPLRLKSAERLANPLLPRKVHRPDSAVTDTFLQTKSDKRLIKHSSFVSRISKPSSLPGSSSAAAKKNAKRHARARLNPTTKGKKSLTTLDALADALPELSAAEVAGGDAEKAGRVRHRSLGSRRGALKKRERVVRHEMDRFALSLAQLQGVKEEEPAGAAVPTPHEAPRGEDAEMAGGVQEKGQTTAPSTAANRFAALRGFIAATMEQNPAFAMQKAKET